jgi:hypothetical protein
MAIRYLNVQFISSPAHQPPQVIGAFFVITSASRKIQTCLYGFTPA